MGLGIFVAHLIVLSYAMGLSYAQPPSDSTPMPCKVESPIRVNTTDRLRRLRHLLRIEGLSGYIIPSEDAHQNEFVPEYAQRLRFISGFSGSSGIAVVLQERAGIWTDSRYTDQLLLQVDCGWKYVSGDVTLADFIRGPDEKEKLRIGVDGRLVTQSWFSEKEYDFKVRNMDLITRSNNLIDEIWTTGEGRPMEPRSSIRIHDLKYAGEPWQNKTKRLRQALAHLHADAIAVSAPDEIAWLFNLRGNDVPYTPVFESFALITQNYAKLYVKRGINRLIPPVRRHLNTEACTNTSEDCVMVLEYNDAYRDIVLSTAQLARILTPVMCSYALCGAIDKDKQLEQDSPLKVFKAIKNDVEIQGMKSAHLKDAVAQACMYAALEKDLAQGKQWSELQIGQKLMQFRREQALYQGDSFETIAASGPNAARAHYVPSVASNRRVGKEDIVLVDTGGQYLDGTVDITRTWHFGEPSQLQKEAYTRVLMGVINLFTLAFPWGVTDTQLDIIARIPLFEAGLTYDHGTGHGVGSYLSVHDVPPHISSHVDGGATVLEPGMFFSIEPGFYRSGDFGIRLETTATVVKATMKHSMPDVQFLKLEPVAFVPFDLNLIVRDLLTPKHEKWLNKYNEDILLQVGKELTRQQRFDAVEWLRRRLFVLDPQKCSSGTSTSGISLLGTLLLLLSPYVASVAFTSA